MCVKPVILGISEMSMWSLNPFKIAIVKHLAPSLSSKLPRHAEIVKRSTDDW